MTFDIFLDIVSNSRQISEVDFKEETKLTKGIVYFKYKEKEFAAIFSRNFLEIIEEVS